MPSKSSHSNAKTAAAMNIVYSQLYGPDCAPCSTVSGELDLDKLKEDCSHAKRDKYKAELNGKFAGSLKAIEMKPVVGPPCGSEVLRSCGPAVLRSCGPAVLGEGQQLHVEWRCWQCSNAVKGAGLNRHFFRISPLFRSGWR